MASSEGQGEWISPLDAEIRAKQAAKSAALGDTDGKLRAWIEAVLEEPLPHGELVQACRNGVALCNLLNRLAELCEPPLPKPVKKVSSSSVAFKAMENLSNFVNACKQLGVPASGCFDTLDVFEKGDVVGLTQTLLLLAGVMAEPGVNYQGPKLDPDSSATERVGASSSGTQAEEDPETTGAAESVTLVAPDDWHHHLRQGDFLPFTTGCAERQFRRAIVMPNTRPPIVTLADAVDYRERILACLPADTSFTPLMTMYLTDHTTPEQIREARASGLVFGVKLYPAGATTNSDSGVTDVAKVYPTLEAMQEVGMPLLVHGEVTDPEVDIFDRESEFIERLFKPLVVRFPTLKFVMEHITTRQGVEFVTQAPPNVCGTITAHHLLYNRNALLVGGIKPHLYCLPILKAEEHRRALLAAVTSGSPKFFLGTDSAPHEVQAKHSACGCAGVFTAHAAVELYAEAFDSAGSIGALEAFCSFNGPDFYGLPRNTDTITLVRRPLSVPDTLPYGGGSLVPLRAGATVAWSRADDAAAAAE